MKESRVTFYGSRLMSNFTIRVAGKGLLLFVVVNLLWAFANPLPLLGRASAYNRLFPGRPRLPYGENPAKAYNLNLFQLDALFAAHELSAGPKPADEFRVLLIGDSSVWGFLLWPEDTLAARLNTAQLTAPEGKRVRVYNLGYPIMSLTKDLLILDTAVRRCQPDLIVWLVTLESFPADKQLFHPLLQHNPQAVRPLISQYHLRLDPNDENFVQPTFWDRTLVGQRRDIADVLRLQLYGGMWAATGIDQDYPATYDRPQRDFEATDTAFHELQPPHLAESDLAFDVLRAGVEAAGSVPVLFVNEPTYISDGQNSNVRYNFFYPRWAYDDYRQMLAEQSRQPGWHYLDLWNLVPASEFTNSAVHLTPLGSQMLADKVAQGILSLLDTSQ
jgi:hypothetical protein